METCDAQSAVGGRLLGDIRNDWECEGRGAENRNHSRARWSSQDLHLSVGGEDRTYKTTDKTVFRVGTKNGTWSDLKLGERVNIFYRVVGTDRIADRVTIEKR